MNQAKRENQRFAGVIAPMITLCTEQGQIDPAATERYASALAARGCDGIFVVSSTGGMPFLDEQDRRELIAAARRGTPADKTLYAGISGMGLKQTIRYAHEAKEQGADAAVVMSPFFLRISQSELLRYLLQVADACPIPLCVYHHLGMPTPVEVDTVARLAAHPNIVALKDTSTSADRMKQLIQATRHTHLTLLQGSEPIILEALRDGAHGCVAALANIAPEWHRELLRGWQQGRHADADMMQNRILALWEMFKFPQMKISFSYFARALSLGGKYRGWCDSAGIVVPGFQPDAEFDRQIIEHFKQVALPGAEA